MQGNESSHCNSDEFGDKMGEGWKTGLLRLGLTFQMRLNWKIFELSRNLTGDIDGAVSFDYAIFSAMAKIPR